MLLAIFEFIARALIFILEALALIIGNVLCLCGMCMAPWRLVCCSKDYEGFSFEPLKALANGTTSVYLAIVSVCSVAAGLSSLVFVWRCPLVLSALGDTFRGQYL